MPVPGSSLVLQLEQEDHLHVSVLRLELGGKFIIVVFRTTYACLNGQSDTIFDTSE